MALLLVYFAHVWFGISVGGLMDPSYMNRPWTWDKALSVAAHIWIPVIVIGTSGTLENLVSMAVSQHGSEIIRHRLLTQMTLSDFDDVYKRLLRSPVAERKRLPGLDPGRADQIVAGANFSCLAFFACTGSGSSDFSDEAATSSLFC